MRVSRNVSEFTLIGVVSSRGPQCPREMMKQASDHAFTDALPLFISCSKNSLHTLSRQKNDLPKLTIESMGKDLLRALSDMNPAQNSASLKTLH